MVHPHKTVHPARSVAQKRHSSAGGPAASPASTPTRGTGRSAARSVGTFVPKLTRTVFEKYGFSTAQLLTDWPQIAGATLAQSTCPDRIVWPRVPVRLTEGEQPAAPRSCATLHLRVDPAHALDVQYKSALLIDRINAYFGYRAVSGIRLIQTPLGRPEAPRSPQPAAQSTLPAAPTSAPALTIIGDDALRAALERMQHGLLNRRR